MQPTNIIDADWLWIYDIISWNTPFFFCHCKKRGKKNNNKGQQPSCCCLVYFGKGCGRSHLYESVSGTGKCKSAARVFISGIRLTRDDPLNESEKVLREFPFSMSELLRQGTKTRTVSDDSVCRRTPTESRMRYWLVISLNPAPSSVYATHWRFKKEKKLNWFTLFLFLRILVRFLVWPTNDSSFTFGSPQSEMNS